LEETVSFSSVTTPAKETLITVAVEGVTVTVSENIPFALLIVAVQGFFAVIDMVCVVEIDLINDNQNSLPSVESNWACESIKQLERKKKMANIEAFLII
jgi:hypothetical protein